MGTAEGASVGGSGVAGSADGSAAVAGCVGDCNDWRISQGGWNGSFFFGSLTPGQQDEHQDRYQCDDFMFHTYPSQL
jgi:hypothetical protein